MFEALALESRLARHCVEELLEEPLRTIDRLAGFLAAVNLPILHRPTSGGIFTASNSSFDAGESGSIDRSRSRVPMDVLLPDKRYESRLPSETRLSHSATPYLRDTLPLS